MNNKKNNSTIKSILLSLLGSTIYALAVVWVLDLGLFYAGGVTGVSQLINRLFGKFTDINISTGLLITLINTPLYLLGYKNISKKFALLTMLSIITQSTLVALLEQIDFNPIAMAIAQEASNGTFELTESIRLILAVIGGGVAGLGTSICLSSGGSTGGMDIISNTLMIKKQINFVKYTFIIDIIIIIIGGIFFGILTAFYTVIRLIVSCYTINLLYVVYHKVKIEVITKYGTELRDVLLDNFHHGITIVKAQGGYTMNENFILEIYVSQYEVQNYIDVIRKVDPKAFIVTSQVNKINGNFKQRTIA